MNFQLEAYPGVEFQPKLRTLLTPGDHVPVRFVDREVADKSQVVTASAVDCNWRHFNSSTELSGRNHSPLFATSQLVHSANAAWLNWRPHRIHVHSMTHCKKLSFRRSVCCCCHRYCDRDIRLAATFMDGRTSILTTVVYRRKTSLLFCVSISRLLSPYVVSTPCIHTYTVRQKNCTLVRFAIT